MRAKPENLAVILLMETYRLTLNAFFLSISIFNHVVRQAEHIRHFVRGAFATSIVSRSSSIPKVTTRYVDLQPVGMGALISLDPRRLRSRSRHQGLLVSSGTGIPHPLPATAHASKFRKGPTHRGLRGDKEDHETL